MADVGNPFPGLRSFDVLENHLFFGRDEQVDALLGKLAQHRFVCVVGTSGSGKSSLVRAGLLPVLYGGFMATAGSSWRIAMFRPGADPLHNLATALSGGSVSRADGDSDQIARIAVTEATLESSSLGLVQMVRQSQLGADENLLLVVDQFEELFRFKESSRTAGAADEAAAFVKLLLAAVSQRELPIYVVLTVRSDFLGDCAQYHDLPEAINDGQYLIPRLRREQLRLAICGPIAVGGGKIAPRLVQQLLNDVGDDPDQLPILQHALMRTWDAWLADREEGEPIDLRHYHAVGDMRTALSQHADEAFNELPDERSRRVAESMFKSLTELGGDNRGIRRPTMVRTICAVADASLDEVVDVVEVFRRPGRSFIMPPAGVELGPETVLDISHESLMRVWARLGAWVRESAESARIYRRLIESAVLFEMGHAALWRDPELQLAVDWFEREKPNEAWGHLYHLDYGKAMAFLAASQRDRDAELEEKRRFRWLARAAAVAFVICAGLLSAWALMERGSAKASADNALQQRSIAVRQSSIAQRQAQFAREQKASAEASFGVAQQQRQRAEQQRREAERQRQMAEQQKREAMAQRQRAEQFGRQAIGARDIAEGERRRALEQQQLAERARSDAEASERNALRMRLLSIGRSLALKSLEVHRTGDHSLAALLALQGFRFFEANGGPSLDPDLYSALTLALKSLLPSDGPMTRAHTGGVRAVAFSPDGLLIASAGADGAILLWNASRPDAAPRVVAREVTAVRSVAFAQSGRTIAYGCDNGEVHVSPIEGDPAGRQSARLNGGSVVSVGFIAGERSIVALASDGRLRRWDLRSDKVDEIPSDGSFRSMGVSGNGRVVVAGGANGTVSVWLLERDATPRVLSGGRGTVQSITVGFNGDDIAAGYSDGVIRVWNRGRSEARSLHGHSSPVHGLAFERDGSLLASAGGDATVRIWKVGTDERPVVIREHSGWVWSVAFAPDGEGIVSGGYDRTLRLWPTDLGALSRALELRLGRNLTRSEWNQFVGEDLPFEKTVPRIDDQ